MPPTAPPQHLTATADSLARLFTREAIGALVEIVRGAGKPADRLRAAEALLDRGYGRATQAIISVPARQAVAQRLAMMDDAALLAIASAGRQALLHNAVDVGPTASDGGGVPPGIGDPTGPVASGFHPATRLADCTVPNADGSGPRQYAADETASSQELLDEPTAESIPLPFLDTHGLDLPVITVPSPLPPRQARSTGEWAEGEYTSAKGDPDPYRLAGSPGFETQASVDEFVDPILL
jgi:hypothetical protein